MPEFVKDVEELRRRAVSKLDEGPVTSSYQLDKNRTIAILNDALATEIVCVLRYMHHYFMATGVHGRAVAGEFKEHADAEREHADALAERIQQLGGKPDYNPASLVQRSASQYVEGESLGDMIREDLVAERIVIQVYSEMIRYFGAKDPTTRVLLEKLLADEEEHASDLTDLLYIVEPSSGKTEGIDPGTDPLEMHPEKQQRGPGRDTQTRREGGRGEVADIGKRLGRGNQPQGALRTAPATEQEAPPEESAQHGHPIRQRPRQTEELDLEPAAKREEGGQMGTTRAVRVTKPNRKKRVA